MSLGHDRYSLHTFIAFFAAIWLWAFRAQTQAPVTSELALAWQAPGACPDSAWARARIAAHLGRAIGEGTAQLSARVEIRSQAPGFRLWLSMSDTETRSERSIEDARCEDLADAAALIIALAVGESAQAGAKPAAPSAPVKPATDSEIIPALQGKPRPLAQTRDRGLRVQLGGVLDYGFLPEPGIGPALWVGLQGNRLGIYLGARGLLPQQSQGKKRVRVDQWAGSIAGCLRAFSRARIELLPCADLELGRVDASGRGLSENLDRHTLFVGLGARVALKLRVWNSIWVSAEPGLSVPLLRPRFVTLDTAAGTERTLYTPQPVSGRASLGIELHF